MTKRMLIKQNYNDINQIIWANFYFQNPQNPEAMWLLFCFYFLFLGQRIIHLQYDIQCADSIYLCRWLKFEEDVEDGGERWSKPYVATLSLHSLFELRSCILNGTVLLDMHANTLEEIAGTSFFSFSLLHFYGHS